MLCTFSSGRGALRSSRYLVLSCLRRMVILAAGLVAWVSHLQDLMAEFLEGVLLECLWLQLLFRSDQHVDFLPHPSWHLFNCFISLITWYFYLCLIVHQVVVASFIAEGKKSKPAEARKVEPMAAPPPQMATFVPAPVATSPPSEGTSSASSDDSGSPINHSVMPFNHSSQHQHPHQHQHMPPAYASGVWSLSVHQQNRHDSDMKMMSN